MKKLTFQEVSNDLIDVLGQDPMVYTLVRRKPNIVTAVIEEGGRERDAREILTYSAVECKEYLCHVNHE